MTCLSRTRLTFFFSFLGLLVSACEQVSVTSVGIVRNPQNKCAEERREFSSSVAADSGVPGVVPSEWCAVFEGSDRLTCFLYSENNSGSFNEMSEPRKLEHREIFPKDDHEDWSCWEKERAAWLEEDDPGPPSVDDSSDGDPTTNDGGATGN